VYDANRTLLSPTKMISEIVNALFLTFVFTEYHTHVNIRPSLHKSHVLVRLGAAAVSVAFINFFDRVVGVDTTARFLEQALHAKVLVAALIYLTALYVDCAIRHNVSGRRFCALVSKAFCTILPLYPFLAILISFGFLLVINVFTFLKLPLQLLNGPIYYGTLYGPFSYIYVNVKSQVINEEWSLPA
jgi:hypothetical protein